MTKLTNNYKQHLMEVCALCCVVSKEYRPNEKNEECCGLNSPFPRLIDVFVEAETKEELYTSLRDIIQETLNLFEP